MDLWDLAPATLLALIITGCWCFGFALGAAGYVLTRILAPAYRRYYALNAEHLRALGATYTQISHYRKRTK